MKKLSCSVRCPKCNLHHKKKSCPVLTGKLLPKWKTWFKSIGAVGWYVDGEQRIIK